jgi:predicted Zn-dependent protease
MTKTERMSQIEALLELEPNDAFLRYGLAMEHVSIGNDDMAATLLKELVDSQPNDPYVPAFLMAGQAYQRLGEEKAAANILKRGIAAAIKAKNDHARSEMEALLAIVE